MRKDIERLHDILSSIKNIEKYSGQESNIIQDEKDRVWFLYHLQIIGEAAANLSERIIEQYSEIPWYKIIAMRNYLVHEYFGIDWILVKDTIKRILPDFKIKIIQIIKEIDDEFFEE
ncbi:DUF86 domain-containing protein [bacterium]|nr:DUF86 domain-containing protein [FCB group bacterium]MBL7191814.1 DUF86 domain-containing protein [bacterium]